MGKISDALDKHSEESQIKVIDNRMVSPIITKTKPVAKYTAKEDLDWYEDIKTKIFTHYPGESIKTIMFSGMQHGGGVTTTVINFAKTLANDGKIKVLLIDVNMRTPSFQQYFSINHDRGLSDIIVDGNHKSFKVMKMGEGHLFVLPTGGNYTGPVSLLESERFDEFLKSAREMFDYILLDSAPIPKFSESRVLCEKVDGVVMVVQSGKVRKQVAKRAKKELEDAGARILGVVLNKRKHYIPEWIYKRL